MSHLIWIYTVCPLVFEFPVCYSLDKTVFEILQTYILSSAFLAKLGLAGAASLKPQSGESLQSDLRLAQRIPCDSHQIIKYLLISSYCFKTCYIHTT